MVGQLDDIRAVVDPIVRRAGATVYDVERAADTVRVLVDRDGGIDLDELAGLSREISRTLDDVDPIPGRYTLEVSSPGLERPLRTPEHFAAVMGERVSIRLSRPLDGSRRVTGTLRDSSDQTIRVQLDDETTVDVDLDAIQRARTVFVWERGTKPGKAARR